MLRHKNIDRICCIVLALTVLVSGLFVGAAATGVIAEDTVIGYETRLFDQSRVHTIDIVMDDWDAFLATCSSEEYSSCHLVIDGESYKNVAIRGKGNTSLSSVQAYGNNRYSFKVEFDHYQSGHTYHGLDKLSLNNLIQDNTYMKDYFAYTLMNKMGVAAPLCSFVQINVNGEPWGLYLAVEGVEDAFLQRNYGKAHGDLYKPDSLSFGGGRGNGMDFDMEDFADMAEQFGFSFGGDGEGEGSSFTMPEMPGGSMPSLPDGFDPTQMMGRFGGSSGESAATAEPTATATPEPTSTPTEAPDDASSGASSGDSAGGSSGMPAIPTDGAMPDMGSMPAMPNGEVPAGSAPTSGEVQAMPEGTTPTMPTGEMPAMNGIPAGTAPTNGEAPAMPEGTTPTMPNGEIPSMPENFDPSQMGGGFEMPDFGSFGGGGGFGMGSDDVKLVYSDDDPDSYSNIFSNAKTDVTEADQTRLIAALKALGEGDTSVVDTDAVIRYMAVHNFLCNDDSYTGMMVHNYYLYEEDGVLAMIPWDYNLAYATMTGSNATSAVNADIDTLVTGGSSDRPMADWITSDETYMAQYRAVYQDFMTTVFDSGWFAQEIDRVIAMISPYVESDPTAFCTYEEFLTGAETLRQFCLKRAESVTNQLNGDDTRVDASGITLSDMGTMNNAGMDGFEKPDMNFGGRGDRGEKPAAPEQTASARGGEAFKTEESPKPEESSKTENPASTDESPKERRAPDAQFDMSAMGQQRTSADGWIWLAVCMALLCAALFFAKTYRTNR